MKRHVCEMCGKKVWWIYAWSLAHDGSEPMWICKSCIKKVDANIGNIIMQSIGEE